MDTARAPEGTAGNFPEIVEISLDSPEVFVNRELSWLAFARRVLALVEDPALPLLERIKFAGIMGMLHDEFFMKRIGGLKRQVRRAPNKLSLDGRHPAEELLACREEILSQMKSLSRALRQEILPALKRDGLGILDWSELTEAQQVVLRPLGQGGHPSDDHRRWRFTLNPVRNPASRTPAPARNQ